MLKGIVVRAIRDADKERLQEINEAVGLFPFPDLDSPLYIIQGTVEKDGKIIGAGMIKLTAEAVVILDKDSSDRDKSEALRELFLIGKAKAVKIGLSQIHAFLKTSQKSFARVLRKSFNFQKIDDEVYLLNLED